MVGAGGAGRLSRAYAQVVLTADRVDDRFRGRAADALSPGHPGAVPATWASVKLIGTAVVSPLMGPVVLGLAAWRTHQAIERIRSYPALIESVMAGRPPTQPGHRVGTVEGDAALFISSDLHRCVPGTVDWVRFQRTDRLYEAALDFYADRDWVLVENGDVEDFWLTEGSAYGVVYDVARLLAAVLPGASGASLQLQVRAEHLRRIVANNKGIYDRIDQRFHRYGRYRRIVGNHDDVFLDAPTAALLADVHAGLDVHDFLVVVAPDPDPDQDPDQDPVADPDVAATLVGVAGAAAPAAGAHRGDGGIGGPGTRAIGVITHGHHTDGWNAPTLSGLGRMGTWLGSALLDAPFGANPGMPDADETERLVSGHLADLLTRVSRRFGANREMYSLDEVLMYDVWRRRWPAAAGPAASDHEPWLVFGHTHVPLIKPIDPETGGVWSRYANSGAGIFFECVTGIEWDGRDDPAHPAVNLVVWRYADASAQTPAAAIVAWDGDRPIVREVLDRVPPSDRLAPVARGHDRPPVDA